MQGVEGLSIGDRLENLQQRLQVNKRKGDKIRAGKLSLSNAEKKFWTTPEWTHLDFVHVCLTTHFYLVTWLDVNIRASYATVISHNENTCLAILSHYGVFKHANFTVH